MADKGQRNGAKPPSETRAERGGRNGAATPAPETEDKSPKTWRERWDKGKEDFRKTVAATPRAFKLVWEASPGLTVAFGILAVVGGGVPAVTAWISKLLVDAVVNAARSDTHPINTVLWLVAAQFGMSTLSALMWSVRSLVEQSLRELTANQVQLALMQHANRLDLASFEDPKFYDKLQQAQREAGYRPLGIVQAVFNLVGSLITFLSLIALMARLGWIVAVIALIAPIPSFIASSRFGSQGYWLAWRQSPDRRKMSYFLDLLTKDSYNKEIKLFGLGQHFMERWKEIADRFYRENRSLQTRRTAASFAWGNLTTLVTSGTFLFVALRVVQRQLTIGDLTFYTQAVGYVQSSFQGILGSITAIYEASLYLNTLFEFLDFQPQIRNKPDAVALQRPLQAGIEFRNVVFTYPGKEEPALRGINFIIGLDETVALVGENGAGKTTIVKLLTRLYEPDEGEIFLNGRDIRDYDLASLRAAIGVIFQDYVTYFLSASENIGVGRLADQGERIQIEDAAMKSGADAVIEKLPDGYDTTLGKWFDEGYQLSGGEWQKVALARAFMRDADILILDEPTASLDARAEYEIFARMQQLTEGKMALFISHRFSTVRLADRILVLEYGKIIEDGPHERLLAQNGVYAELFNLQAAAYR